MSVTYAVDIGNSDVVIGRWSGNEWEIQKRIPTKKSTSDLSILESALYQERAKVEAVIVSSVVPFNIHDKRQVRARIDQKRFNTKMGIEGPDHLG